MRHFGHKFPRKQAFFGKYLEFTSNSTKTGPALMVVFILPARVYKENLTPAIDLGLFNPGFLNPLPRIARASDYLTPKMFTLWINP